MDTGEVPRERWQKFLDGFSKDHEGWIVSLEVIGPMLGAQEEATGLPLVGISADGDGSKNRIEIIIGDRTDAHVTRSIVSPKRVLLKEPETGGHEAIDVESDDGTLTLLRFRHIEQLDRLLPERSDRKERQTPEARNQQPE